MYEGLGLKSLKFIMAVRRLCILYKVIKFEISKYLHNISLSNHQHNTRSKDLKEFTQPPKHFFFSVIKCACDFLKNKSSMLFSISVCFVSRLVHNYMFTIQPYLVTQVRLYLRISIAILSFLFILFFNVIFSKPSSKKGL